MKNAGKQKGFTLVELLVVIAIIALLAIFAVGAYTDYRRQALLDLAADDLISQINDLKGKTLYGNFGGETENSKCFGVFFDPLNNDFSEFETDFNPLKVWDSLNRKWVDSGCEDFSVLTETAPIVLDPLIRLEKMWYLKSDGTEDEISDKTLVVFRPPNGEVELKDEGNNEVSPVYTAVKVLIRYGESNQERYKKYVIFARDSGKASKQNL